MAREGWDASSARSADGGTIFDLVTFLRRRWWLILLVVAPVVAGAVYYTEALPAVYTSEASFSLEPRVTDGDAGDPATVRLIAPSYAQYITAPATLRELADGTSASSDELEDMVDASVADDASILTVSVTSGDPDVAQRIASAAADEIEAFADDDQLINARLIAPAVVPTAPTGPPRRLIEAAAAIVALALGLAVAFVVDRARRRIESEDDVVALTDWPVLGRVPRTRRLPQNPLLAFSDARVATAVRTLRVQVESSISQGSTLVVTSPTLSEGKTTIVTMLGVALARVGFKVVVVDADLRRPRVGDTLPNSGDGGLAAVLRGRSTLADVARPGWVDGLTVVPTERDPEAGDLLSQQLETIMKEARSLGEVVLIDAPPLLGTDEAHALAFAADAVLFVVSVGTPLDVVGEAVVALSSLRTRVIGAVVNRVRRSTMAYGYGA